MKPDCTQLTRSFLNVGSMGTTKAKDDEIFFLRSLFFGEFVYMFHGNSRTVPVSEVFSLWAGLDNIIRKRFFCQIAAEAEIDLLARQILYVDKQKVGFRALLCLRTTNREMARSISCYQNSKTVGSFGYPYAIVFRCSQKWFRNDFQRKLPWNKSLQWKRWQKEFSINRSKWLETKR